MKKGNLLLRCLLVLLCLPVTHIFAQGNPAMKIYSGLPPGTSATAKRNPNVTTPVESFIRRVKQTNQFVQVSNIWQPDNNFDQTAMLQKVEKAQPLTINYTAVASLIQQNTTAISLVVPGIGGGTFTIDLAQYSYLSNSFQVHTMTGDVDAPFSYTPGKYYSGVVDGIPGSVAAFSFFKNEVFGIFSIPGVGNMVLVPNRMPGVGNYYNYNQHYILYNDFDLKIKDQAPKCGTDMLPVHSNTHSAEISTTTLNNNVYNNCKEVRVYELGDYALYQTEGSSVANATNYLTALFNNQATLYKNEGIPIVLNYVQIDNAADAFSAIYTGASSTNFLNMFGGVTQNNLHGSDLAILAATDQNGGYGALGGLAWLQSACTSWYAPDSSGPYCFCDLDDSTAHILGFPTYSWDVEVMTHEMGHEVGSPHTHRCCWNPPGSGNTAIDCCYCLVTPVTDRLEASPTGAPLCAIPSPETPAAGGTIMSYCHLISTGINFSNGFGTQPGDTVRYYVANHMPCSIQYNPNTALQTASRSISANRECTDLTSGITYYWNDNNTADQGDDTLVLEAKLGTNTIGDLNTAGFAVTANTVVRYGSGYADTITFPAGTSASILSQNYSMRRYWNITPTSTPATAVEIMFPFLSTDTTDVHGSVPGSAPLSGYLAYTTNSGISPNPSSGFPGATASDFSIYTYSVTPSTTNWALTTVGTTQFADMMMTNVATGGTLFYSYCTQLAAPTGVAATNPCPGTVITYSVTPVAGAVSYSWTVSGTGWSGTSTTNSINLTAGTGVATISAGAVASCGGVGNLYTFNITPSPLPVETIATTTPLCTGLTSVGLSATATAGSPTSYTWTVAGTGWSGSGSGSSITAVAGTGTGTVTVTGTNSCGTGTAATLLVTMNAVAPVAPTSITPPAIACPSSTATFTTPAVPGATSYNWSVAGTGWSGFSTTSSINVNVGTGLGTLTVSAANACGTSANYSTNITPSTAPGSATSITGPTDPCAGSTVTFTTPAIGTASSYNWTVTGVGWSGSSSTNSINVVAGSGPGTITVSPVNACGTGSSYTLSPITSLAAPTATFALSSHIASVNSPVAIIYTGVAPTGSTFSWNFSGGTATPGAGSGPQSVYWSTPGQYLVFLTVNSGTGCFAAYADSVSVISGTGVQNVNAQNIDASIVPNPNNGSFDILFSESVNQPVSVKLYDMQGRVVYNNDFTGTVNNRLPIETDNLPPGTYAVTIYVNQSAVTKKITIYK